MHFCTAAFTVDTSFGPLCPQPFCYSKPHSHSPVSPEVSIIAFLTDEQYQEELATRKAQKKNQTTTAVHQK